MPEWRPTGDSVALERPGSVVGVDLSGLSGSTRGRTWAAELALGRPTQLVSTVRIGRGVAGDRELVEWITSRQPLVVAIDAPLTLPHSIVCEDTDCPRCALGAASYLERDTDKLARADGGAMPFVMLAAIAFRGIYLARVLGQLGIQVIETYPAAAYRAMGLVDRDYGARAAALVERIGPFEWREPDEVDAICAAVVANDYVTSRGRKIEGVDGVIWLPAPTAS
jgi:predicted nuclease with RNAse H fold